MPRKNKRKTPQEQFSERVNQGFQEAAGVRTGGHEMPETHRAVNDWVREQAKRGTIQKPLQGEGDGS